MAAWWGAPGDVESEYFGRVEPVERFLALLDGRPVGMVQSYLWESFPQEARGVGARPGELGIDYLLGEADAVGRGVGPEMLRAFLARARTEALGLTGVRVDVAEANRRSWRCLEKLGFVREAEGVAVAGEPGPHYVYALAFTGDRRSPP